VELRWFHAVTEDIYGQLFRRTRLEAAVRLARPDFADRAVAAREIGLSDSFLKKIESGEKRPGFETLRAMARAYNCREGDLLPSLAPKGPEVDRILAPLLSLDPDTRALFITQMEAFARTLASSINTAVERAQASTTTDVYNPTPDGSKYDKPALPVARMRQTRERSAGVHEGRSGNAEEVAQQKRR
jgi:transcriptional regulator with XRE-family HTH domain